MDQVIEVGCIKLKGREGNETAYSARKVRRGMPRLAAVALDAYGGLFMEPEYLGEGVNEGGVQNVQRLC